MKRFVRMFQPRFAAMVKAGQKKQTIRPVPSRMPSKGDILDARQWHGLPYRSTQDKIGEYKIWYVAKVEISTRGILLDGESLTDLAQATFARLDGFKDFADLIEWLQATHALPFKGIVIYWEWE